MPKLWQIILILSAATVGMTSADVDQNTNTRIAELTDCQLSYPGYPMRIAAKCGMLTVYENRRTAIGRKIDLHLAVIKALRRTPEPDPLFFLAGGPGQAATEAFVPMHPVFSKVGRSRDIVLLDQRGTGKSSPLKCPDSGEDPIHAGIHDPERVRQWIGECLADLEGDPTQYITSIAVEDLDDVRKSLGYDRINIYGVSYGTRVALTYLKAFPQHVRTLTLDGVVPLDEAVGQDVARDSQRALDLALDRCLDDPSCSDAFPNIKDDVYDLIDRLADQPMELSIPHPRSGNMTSFTLNRDLLVSTIRLFSYSDSTISLLPLLVHDALETGNFERLAAQSLMVHQELAESIAYGMHTAVLCTEDIPFIDFADMESQVDGTYLAGLPLSPESENCDIWPKGSIPEGFRSPAVSQVPTLLLSGEADPVTPPENAAKAAVTLPNHLHIVAPGKGHGVVGIGCIPTLVASFIDSASVSGFDTDCVGKIRPDAFFIDFSGPSP